MPPSSSGLLFLLSPAPSARIYHARPRMVLILELCRRVPRETANEYYLRSIALPPSLPSPLFAPPSASRGPFVEAYARAVAVEQKRGKVTRVIFNGMETGARPRAHSPPARSRVVWESLRLGFKGSRL
jgi:hypothetical protein